MVQNSMVEKSKYQRKKAEEDSAGGGEVDHDPRVVVAVAPDQEVVAEAPDPARHQRRSKIRMMIKHVRTN